VERQQHSSHPSSQTNKVRFCTARLTPACREQRGRFLATGERGKAPRYCPECAKAKRREQIRDWKNQKRKELGSAEYQRQYGSTYSLDAEQRERWREQKRRQRSKSQQRQAG
jgi:hypothetical protein